MLSMAGGQVRQLTSVANRLVRSERTAIVAAIISLTFGAVLVVWGISVGASTMTGATYFLDNKTECYPHYFNGPAVSLHIRIDNAELYSLWIADSKTGLVDIYITDTPTGSVICGEVVHGLDRKSVV